MPIIPRKGVAAIAAVLDIALHGGRALSANLLGMRHQLPPRYLEPFLQEMVRRGILQGVRGSHGGYKLASDLHRTSILDILRAIEVVDTSDDQVKKDSVLINQVVMPILNNVERSFAAALRHVSLKDLADAAEDLRTPSDRRQDQL
jgi:Rrf2 family protein